MINDTKEAAAAAGAAAAAEMTKSLDGKMTARAAAAARAKSKQATAAKASGEAAKAAAGRSDVSTDAELHADDGRTTFGVKTPPPWGRAEIAKLREIIAAHGVPTKDRDWETRVPAADGADGGRRGAAVGDAERDVGVRLERVG